MTTWIKRIETWPRQFVALVCILIVAAVGLADYLTGYEIFFFTFYLVAVFLAAWSVGFSFGVLISALSVAAWISADVAAGLRYSSYFISVWNAAIMFSFYLVVVALLTRLRALQKNLEERVRLRTAALTQEMQERQRLQKDLLETSEREQRRLGLDLHDGLCQHLTGTALAGHLLGQQLAAKSLPESASANRLVELVEEAIELTRTLSRGLHAATVQNGNLTDHFRELAADTRERFKVDCQFETTSTEPLPDAVVATHLYRIAQEAVANAVRHGKAAHINICLDSAGGEHVLTVTDDGTGLPENAGNGKGLGLRLMAYRAELIGAAFQIERLPGRGTRVTCTLPDDTRPRKNHAQKN
jgi:signal transduction histidine kinase